MENRQIHCRSKTKKVLVVEKITNILIKEWLVHMMGIE